VEAAATKNGILAILAAIGSVIANQLGGWDCALMVLICMMAVDYITGILLGAVFHASPKTTSGKLSSNESFKGLVRKFLVLILVWVAAMLDRVTGAAYIRTAIVLFFIANEGLSILENTAAMGVPYPKFIKTMLESIKDKSDNADDEAE
jgi:toxin secretion/phage lysis holin